MGVVLSGIGAGAPIKISYKYKCLYVKNGSKIMPLDSERVTKYDMKEAKHGAFTSIQQRVFVIHWINGKKSVIQIDKADMTLLITGCESIALTDEQIQSLKKGSMVGWIILGVILAIIIFLLMNAILQSGPNRNASPFSSNHTEPSSESLSTFSSNIESQDSSAPSGEHETVSVTDSSKNSPNNQIPASTDGEAVTGDISLAEEPANRTADTSQQNTDSGTSAGPCLYDTLYGDLYPSDAAELDSQVQYYRESLDRIGDIVEAYTNSSYAEENPNEYRAYIEKLYEIDRLYNEARTKAIVKLTPMWQACHPD